MFVVCSYLTHRKCWHSAIIDVQNKTCPVLLKSNTSCRQPLFTLFLLYKYFFLFISYKSLIWLRFYIDVCPLKSNCHACIFSVLEVFGIFIYKKSYFIWKIRLYEVQKGALSSCGYVLFSFLCVGERVCACQTSCTFLELFRWRLVFVHLVNSFTAFVKLFWVDALYKSVSK